jgi:hypothetical protein
MATRRALAAHWRRPTGRVPPPDRSSVQALPAALALRRWHAVTVTGESAMACTLPEHWQRAARVPSGRTKRTAQDATQACPVHMHAPRPRVWIGSSLCTGVTAYCAERLSTPALSWAQTRGSGIQFLSRVLGRSRKSIRPSSSSYRSAIYLPCDPPLLVRISRVAKSRLAISGYLCYEEVTKGTSSY